MEARYMTAELKVSEKSARYTFGDSVPAGAKQLAPIRQLTATATTIIATFMGSPLLEYLVERASAALAKRMKENARPPAAVRINHMKPEAAT